MEFHQTMFPLIDGLGGEVWMARVGDCEWSGEEKWAVLFMMGARLYVRQCGRMGNAMD